MSSAGRLATLEVGALRDCILGNTATINHICKEESPAKLPLPHTFLSASGLGSPSLCTKETYFLWDVSAKLLLSTHMETLFNVVCTSNSIFIQGRTSPWVCLVFMGGPKGPVGKSLLIYF